MKEVQYTIHRENITEFCVLPPWFPKDTQVFSYLLSLDVGIYIASGSPTRECETVKVRVEFPVDFVRDLLDHESESLDDFEAMCEQDCEVSYIAYYTGLPVAYQGTWTYEETQEQDLLCEILDYLKCNGFPNNYLYR